MLSSAPSLAVKERVFETLAMGVQLNPSGEFDSCLQPSKDGTPNGTVCHGIGWVEYAWPLVSLIMAYIIIGITDSINISITDRLVCWLVGMISPRSPAPTLMRLSMIADCSELSKRTIKGSMSIENRICNCG